MVTCDFWTSKMNAVFCKNKSTLLVFDIKYFTKSMLMCLSPYLPCLWIKGSPTIRNGGGKSRFWTPSWLFLTFWTCGFSVFYVKEASCLISSSSATFTLSSFSSSMTSLISSSTCPILTFYTFLPHDQASLVGMVGVAVHS